MTVLSQYGFQVLGREAATTQVAAVDVPVADQDEQRWVDRPPDERQKPQTCRDRGPASTRQGQLPRSTTTCQPK